MPESPQMPEFLQFCFRVTTSMSDELTLFRELNSFLWQQHVHFLFVSLDIVLAFVFWSDHLRPSCRVFVVGSGWELTLPHIIFQFISLLQVHPHSIVMLPSPESLQTSTEQRGSCFGPVSPPFPSHHYLAYSMLHFLEQPSLVTTTSPDWYHAEICCHL